MKDQIEFETNGLTVLAVKVPEKSHGYDIGRWAGRYLIFHSGEYEVDNRKTGEIELPFSEWQFHAITTEITRTQAIRLCKLAGIFYNVKAVTSAKNFLRSHGIDPSEKRAILIKQDETK